VVTPHSYSLDEVLDLLDRHRQRATYGAVGEVVKRPPLFLMAGRPRDFRHSWVVSKSTGLPTNYGPQDMHPEIRANDEVLSTGEELAHWMRSRRHTNGASGSA
jgi:hypothetical protein